MHQHKCAPVPEAAVARNHGVRQIDTTLYRSVCECLLDASEGMDAIVLHLGERWGICHPVKHQAQCQNEGARAVGLDGAEARRFLHDLLIDAEEESICE